MSAHVLMADAPPAPALCAATLTPHVHRCYRPHGHMTRPGDYHECRCGVTW